MQFDFTALLRGKFTLSDRAEDVEAKLLCQNIFCPIDSGSDAAEHDPHLQVMDVELSEATEGQGSCRFMPGPATVIPSKCLDVLVVFRLVCHRGIDAQMD